AGLIEHVGIEIGHTDLSPYLAQGVLVVLAEHNCKMVERGLQIAICAGDFPELVIGVDLVFIDLDRFAQVFERLCFLPSLKVNNTKLDVSVGISWVHGCVVQEPFEVLLPSKGIAESAYLAA